MDKLSVAIITKNEEKNIGRCIDSVKDIADEIVVVDSFSTDRTREICLQKGAVFSTNPFAGHIQQKNYAFSRCSHDFVLSLDADEALSDELQLSIMHEKEKGFSPAYAMNRRTNYAGQWIRFGGWYPDTKVRLVKRALCQWAGTNPHDKITFTTAVKPIHLKGDIMHYSIDSVAHHRQIVDNFSTIAARALFEKGKRPSPLKKYVSAVFRFFQSFVFSLGFLEGSNGWYIAWHSARSRYLKYRKLQEFNAQKTNHPNNQKS